MKKIILLIALGTLLAKVSQSAVQSLPFTDSFAYSQGNLYTVGAGVWDAGGNAGPELLVTNSAALTGPSGFTNSSGNGVKWTPSGTARRSIVQFSAITSNTPGTTLYASFLVNLSSVSGTKLFAYFDNSTSQPSSPQLGVFATSSSIGIGKKASTPATSVTVGSGTHLVVVRYTFTGTSTDQADLWVDPTNTSYGAASPPAASGSTSGGSNPSSIPYFGIYAISGSGPTLYMDEVRISTNWPDVVPGTPPPPPPPPVTTPTITHVEMTDLGFDIQGIGGASNGVFDILASTDLTIPVATWPSIGSFNFDGNGDFDVTNPVPDGTDFEFFALHVSNTSTNTPPTITSQPGEQIVQLGQGAVFSVTADGSLPLGYQWYFDTNTVIAAGTNATFTISSVTSNDVGGYSVIVSNTSGSVTSIVVQLSLGEPITNGDFYVANNGTDTNDGSFAHPFYNIQHAADLAQPGNTIYVRGGTFPYVNTIRLQGHSGTSNALVNLWAYPGEHPVLDFSAQPVGSSSRGIFLTNDYWYIKGLDIGHCGDNAIKVEGSHNIVELCVFHDSQDTGLQIGFGHPTNNDGSLAAFNTIINCDSYHNYDTATHGGNADGFACKLHPGAGNIFIGCRAWNNSDDAWDFFESDSTIIVSNCWAWHSGDRNLYPNPSSFGGNGNGFKMGGNGSGGSSKGTHYAINCIAFNCSYGNSKNDFTDNNHADGEILYNCVAWGGNYNFFFEQGVNGGKSNVFKNCVNFAPAGNSGNPVKGVSFGGGTVIQDHNSWTIPLSPSSADFNSIAEAAASAPRQPDGSLPTGFGRLVAGSILIDAGVDVGEPFCGSAPDLGAFEYCP